MLLDTNPNEYYKTLNITPSIKIHQKTIEHVGLDEKSSSSETDGKN